jgi:alkanesulfonate monooxygenase SsuD/methylene tetrahydromethanopterin reductase-like flavin-dependent oxidoreductase (luciferase family)
MIELSVLELGRVRPDSDRRAALDEARALTQHAERCGSKRIWVAEHHNMPTVTTAATSLVIAHIAPVRRSKTSRPIRLPGEKAQVAQILGGAIISGPDAVCRGMDALVQRTQADELMIVSDVFDPVKRLRSFDHRGCGEQRRG